MIDNLPEICSLIMSISGLTHENAERLVLFLIERDYIRFKSNQLDMDRAVFLSRVNGSMSAVSYKLSNIEFNFRKAALSNEIDMIETYLGADAFLKGENPILYLLILCLKVYSNIKVELSDFDAELISFLWKARHYRRLNIDSEYRAFSHHMVQRGQNPLSSIEYHHALDRLEKLHIINLGDGMISLRERVIMDC